MSEQPTTSRVHTTGEATGFIPVGDRTPITVIGTEKIRAGFDDVCIQQAINSRLAPGVTHLVLNPDAHRGFGAPVGCAMVSPTHIYPGPIGVDIKCSMSLLQLDIPADAVADRSTRRALIDAIGERIPTGAGRGQRHARKSRKVNEALGAKALVEGASAEVCAALGIPHEWTLRCEDHAHVGHDDSASSLADRLSRLRRDEVFGDFKEKMTQLGSYGGGNHFGECEVVRLLDDRGDPTVSPLTLREGTGGPAGHDVANTFGLKDNHVAFLSHCGSRGVGHRLAAGQFRVLQDQFARWKIPLPGNDKELVYAPLGTPEADMYLDDMALGANFATVNHMLINALVLEAFQEILPGTKGSLVYFISHNIARREVIDDDMTWVHRKGATRAFPAHHHALKQTPFEATGHPILLPGNPRDGSMVMVANAGAAKSCYSVNHGAGRQMGRRQAMRTLNQKAIDADFAERDILSNCRAYPMDEAPDAYKDFGEVLRSVELAGLARPVAKLEAKFVIKDGDKADD